MADKERALLTLIWVTYGKLIQSSAIRYHHRPEVLAGIMMRESEGGWSPLLNPQGPSGLGDGGHGHGLMQIDCRAHPDFCDGDWKDPEKNIGYGALVLAQGRMYLRAMLLDHKIPEDEMERLSICAYNCGQGRVKKLVDEGIDPDTRTAHGNYAKEVLRLAELYKLVIDEKTMEATT